MRTLTINEAEQISGSGLWDDIVHIWHDLFGSSSNACSPSSFASAIGGKAAEGAIGGAITTIPAGGAGAIPGAVGGAELGAAEQGGACYVQHAKQVFAQLSPANKMLVQAETPFNP